MEAKPIPPDTLVLKLIRDPWRIDIGGSVKDVDVAIAMLNQALEFFKLQKFFIAVEEQQKAMNAVGAVLDGHGRKM